MIKRFQKVIQYAIKGMHFDEYLKNDLFFKYTAGTFGIWNAQMQRKSLRAYERDMLLGVLIADMKDEPKPYKSFERIVC